ncbi:unnamed protein product, partial [Ectocarpus fasciculatus]
MVKLYYSPNSAGAAAFLAARAGGVSLETEQVDLREHVTIPSGADYYAINPRGTVPCLVLDDGTLLTEVVSVLAYIGSMHGPGGRATMPPGSSSSYFKALGLLSFISTELHALFGHLLNPNLPEEMQEIMRRKLQAKLQYMNADTFVDNREYMVGGAFSAADAYMYVVLSWAAHTEVDIDGYKHIRRYYDRLAAMPFVAEAFEA